MAAILDVPTVHQTNLDGKDGLRLRSRGKVRDIYEREGKDFLYVATTDRISAYDKVLPRDVPEKGRTLNTISAFTFRSTRDLVPNHLIDSPDPNVMVVQRVDERYPVEIIVRGMIAGSLWKRYAKGERNCYSYQFPEGLKENQELPGPIVTPTTKAEVGHDMPIDTDEKVIDLIQSHMKMTRGEAERNWTELKEMAVILYKKGDEIARANGGRLADTKYEAGKFGGKNIIIDEAHTPDSSRYLKQAEYEERFAEGKRQNWIDKQYVRDWLTDKKWTGEECGPVPEIPDEVIATAAGRYLDCVKIVTGSDLKPLSEPISEERILKNLRGW